MRLEREADIVGSDLEAAPDDGLVGPADDPEEAVGVEAGQVGGADPAAVRPELAAFTSSRPSSSVPSTCPSCSSTTRSSQPAWARPTLPRLVAQYCSWSAQVPPGDAAAELGGGVRDEHRDAVLVREGVGVVGRQRRGARHHRADAAELGRVEVGFEHHAQRGGHEAGRLRAVTADGVVPAVDGEALQQRERPAVVDALEDPEQPAEVDERRVDDGDAGPQPGVLVAVGLVVLGVDEDALERVVGQVDPLRRSGRAAGEHADGDVGPHVVGSPARALRRSRRPRARRQLVERRSWSSTAVGPTSVVEIVGRPDDAREVERGDVVTGAIDAAVGVDRDDAAAGAQHAEQEADVSGPVAQDDADLRAGLIDVRGHGLDGRAELAPRLASGRRTRSRPRRGRSRRPRRSGRATSRR